MDCNLRDLFRFCYEQITDPLGLPISPIAEYIIIYILHRIVYRLAFNMVGDLYRTNVIDGRLIGSFLHWFLRGICFIAVWAIANGVIIIWRFVVKYWLFLFAGFASVFVLVIVTMCIYHLKQNRKMREIKVNTN